jgi:hypothetical protein
MGESNAQFGTGIILAVGDGATPENFTEIAELVEVKMPQLSRKVVDVTPHNTALTIGSQEILGMLKKGPVQATVNWIPLDATHRDQAGGLLYDIVHNVKRNYQLQMPPDGYPEWTFPARVSVFDPESFKVDVEMQVKIQLAVAGEIVIVEEES